MTRIQHISALSAFKLGLLIFAAIGLVGGALCSAIAFAGVRLPHHPTLVGGIALMPVVVCPIAWGLVGGAGAAIVAFLYNAVASWIGGLEVDVR